MRIASWLGIASVALIAAGCAPYTYNSDTPRSERYYGATAFNGTWRLVPSRSDYTRDWLDERSRFDADDWGTSDRTSDRTGDRAYARQGAWFLPDEFRMSGGRDMVRIEDEGGGLIVEIPFDSDYRYGGYDDQYSRASHAAWINDRQFEVQRLGRNRRLTQTFTLQNRSRRLEVVTRIERDGSTRTFSRMYDRV